MLSINHNQMMLEHYKDVTLVTNTAIQITYPTFCLTVEGNNLHVLAMEKNEMLLEGVFEHIRFTYDK